MSTSNSTAPAILSTYPQNGQTTVPINTRFLVVFNKPVNASTFAANIAITSSTHIPPLLINGADYSIAPGAGSTTSALITFR